MAIGPVGAQENRLTAGLNPGSSMLSAQTQTAAQVDDPFVAYLLSLSDPIDILRAAIARAAAGDGQATRSALPAALAANALRATTLTAPGAAAAVQAAGAVATRATDRLGFAQSAAQAAQEGVAGLAQPSGAGAQASATAASAAAGPSASTAIENPAVTSDPVVQDLATLAANTAALNAYHASTAASAVSEGAADRATDATAKYMGAGALAQNQGPGSAAALAAAAYQAFQEVIPAVIATPSSSALSANAESAGQSRTPVNPGLGRVPGAGVFPILDLTG